MRLRNLRSTHYAHRAPAPQPPGRRGLRPVVLLLVLAGVAASALFQGVGHSSADGACNINVFKDGCAAPVFLHTTATSPHVDLAWTYSQIADAPSYVYITRGPDANNQPTRLITYPDGDLEQSYEDPSPTPTQPVYLVCNDYDGVDGYGGTDYQACAQVVVGGSQPPPPPPPPPPNQRVAPSNVQLKNQDWNAVEITWDYTGSEQIDVYEFPDVKPPPLELSDSPYSASKRSAVDPNLQPRAWYGYRVCAGAEGDFSYCNLTMPTIETGFPPPLAPSDVSLAFVSNGIQVTWTVSDQYDSYFQVERQDPQGKWSAASPDIDNNTTNATGQQRSWTDGNRSPSSADGSLYTYRVCAYGNYNHSACSAGATISVKDQVVHTPKAPTNVQIAPADGGGAIVSWDSTDEWTSSFDIERQDGGGAFAVVGNVPMLQGCVPSQTVRCVGVAAPVHPGPGLGHMYADRTVSSGHHAYRVCANGPVLQRVCSDPPVSYDPTHLPLHDILDPGTGSPPALHLGSLGALEQGLVPTATPTPAPR